MYDLVIKDAIIIDPENEQITQGSMAIKGNEIVPYEDNEPSKNIINAAGKYVSPGFIDFHTHVYSGSMYGINPDLLFPYGVTTVVDQGTVGYINFDSFYNETFSRLMKTYMFINVFPMGQPGGNMPEILNPSLLHLEKISHLLHNHKELIKGIKIKYIHNTIGEFGAIPLKMALDFGHEVGVPVCVHTTDSPASASDILALLRADDIYCHCFQGHGNTILNQNGSVPEEIFDAQQRGVILDAANGCINFDYTVAMKAFECGFEPDVISTDLTSKGFNVPGAAMARNLAFIMSKYLNIGMSIEKIIKAVTFTPARIMGLEDYIGTIKIGSNADLCLFEICNLPHSFLDANNIERIGYQYIKAEATIVDGEIVYLGAEL
ncbi:amidohydrolase family protein [Megasphaera vaginalis (ex Bordigoni et al. 2020)]|uniref:amidohydrolase family protein n=1 Tax=Megasphaera vaginalis (ex Bordigoni et al. 2020) TaxID=2045301 RepID=UPI000C7CC9AA|nr:amidohydrolase family protein [Megasphaera vaginalis (ex Bordigoni et al. 2020)]